MSRVKNKIALITGGSRGIGAETARLLAKEGAKVIVADILRQEGEVVGKRIGGAFHYLDVTSEDMWQELTDNLREQYGRIDVLFNNAGIIGCNENLGPQDPENTSLEAWHHVHKVNLDGVFLGCKYGISLMKMHGGSIINMSSRLGIVGNPDDAAYASSKAAVRNHTKTVALYCSEAGYSIRCNSLHPGPIQSPMTEGVVGNDHKTREQTMAHITSRIPLGFMGEPIDVAYAVLYLGSDESRYITGTELTLDGGMLAGSLKFPGDPDLKTSDLEKSEPELALSSRLRPGGEYIKFKAWEQDQS